ncbi:cerebellar degeneration-related protein 2-like [Amphiura filiformis]|uniref:cerebellar degeneration-related protein 2-like n=1 Tax=Amphiura filiformis TaxID=82378 RepID=UPI003B21C5AF
MIAPRHLALGDGVVSGQGTAGSVAGEAMNHNNAHMGSTVVSKQAREHHSATDGIVDHNMQELEWEEGWYENDLHLAAELGKTLLERNKELDANILTAQQENEEQAMQIVYLEKQLQILRDVTESKAHVYEQLDLNSQDLEKTNHRLEHELRTAQQRIMRMTETIESLESKSLEQQNKIDRMKAAELDRLKEGRRQKKIIESLGSNIHGYPIRRARSFDLGRVTGESVFEDEIVNLTMTIRNLKERLSTKKMEEQEAALELEVLLKENQLLEEKVHKLEVKSQMKEIEQDYSSLNQSNEAICKYCDSLINAEEVEDADDKGKLSAQGGRGSQDLGTITEEMQQSQGDKGEGLSLFTEIDTQYHELMDKYNSLLTRSRSGSFRDESGRPRAGSIRGRKVDSGVQTSAHTTPVPTPTKDLPGVEQEGACVVDAHFSDQPPEYKKLFRDIFSILHKKPGDGVRDRSGSVRDRSGSVKERSGSFKDKLGNVKRVSQVVGKTSQKINRVTSQSS